MDGGRSIVHRKKKASAASNKTCDSKKKASKASWTATSKKALLADGSERVLYRHPDRPGELRLRRIRDGKATYVKPGKTVRVRMMRGGWGEDDSAYLHPTCAEACDRNRKEFVKGVVKCREPTENTPNSLFESAINAVFKPTHVMRTKNCN